METSAIETQSHRGYALREYFRQPNHFKVLSKISSTLEEVLTWCVSSLLELEIHTGAWRCLFLSQPTHPHTHITTPCFKDIVFKSISLNPMQSLGKYESQHLEAGPGCKSEQPEGALAHPDLQRDIVQMELMCFGSANKRFCGDFGISGIDSSAVVGHMERWPLHG